MTAMLRISTFTFALLATAVTAAEPQPAADAETTRLSPSARPVPLPRNFRFEPRPDITSIELDSLGPYLKGKPLYEEDQKALGTAMRHLKEVK
jgi:hypothetical protein